MAGSEVARLLQQISLEHEAAQNALTGLASGSARHDFITLRMELGAERLLELIRQGKHAEVAQIMETTAWGE